MYTHHTLGYEDISLFSSTGSYKFGTAKRLTTELLRDAQNAHGGYLYANYESSKPKLAIVKASDLLLETHIGLQEAPVYGAHASFSEKGVRGFYATSCETIRELYSKNSLYPPPSFPQEELDKPYMIRYFRETHEVRTA